MNPLNNQNKHPIFDQYDVEGILKQPPYISTSPFKTPERVNRVALSALRKADLDRMKVTFSPLKNVTKHEYGKSPFSKLAIQYKRENNITAGRNVAIVLFQLNNNELAYTIAATSGPPGSCAHAELQALDQLPKHLSLDNATIKAIYTERAPCNHGSACYRKIKSVLGHMVPIIYNIRYEDERSLQQIVEKGFQELQETLNVRVAKRRKRPVAKKLKMTNPKIKKVIDKNLHKKTLKPNRKLLFSEK